MLRFWVITVFSGLLWGVMMVASACTPTPTAVAVPTTTLIPITATTASLPTEAVATNTPLPQPANIIATQAANNITFILAQDSIDLADEPLLHADLLQSARNDLADELGVTPEFIQWVRLTHDNIYQASFACATNLPQAIQNQRQYADAQRFRLTLLAGTTTYTYHIYGDTWLPRCEAPQSAQGDLLMAIDPIAAEMVLLARRRISLDEDLPQRRIQLVTLQAYTWRDTSLGCPQPNQTYTTAEINGYRLVMRVGERDFIFHTDAASLFACTPEREQLPTGDDAAPPL